MTGPTPPNAGTVEITTRWVARGTTDDVTTCEHCGKANLKHTVRMVALDTDGNEDGEEYMGTVCAARRTGRTVKEIRTEAQQADRDARDARREAWQVWDAKRVEWFTALRTAAFGPDHPGPRKFREWYEAESIAERERAWCADNPEPPRP